MLLFTRYQFSFISPILANKLNESNGWKEIATEIKYLLKEKNLALPDYLITKHYQTGGAIAFYLGEDIKYYVIQKAKRELVKKQTIAENEAIVVIRSQVPEDKGKIEKIFPQKWLYLGEVKGRVQGKVLRSFQAYLKQK